MGVAHSYCYELLVLYSGETFEGGKLLQILRFCAKISLMLGAVASFGSKTSEQSVKVFSVKILCSESFLPQKFPTIRYIIEYVLSFGDIAM